MKYKYTIEHLDAPNNYMFVKYKAKGRKAIYKNLNPTQFDREYIRGLIRATAKDVVHIWERQETQAEVDLESIGLAAEERDEYVPVVAEKAVPLTERELAAMAVEGIANERWSRESAGVVWSDGTDTFLFDTSIASQNRFAAASAAINSGSRKDGGVWKCGILDAVGDVTLVFRPMLNSELTEVANIVHEHVQKCFDVEKQCYEALKAGQPIDYRDTFDA